MRVFSKISMCLEKWIKRHFGAEESISCEERARQIFVQWMRPRGDLGPDAAAAMLLDEPPSVPKRWMTVDVVIPVYDGFEHLERLLPSLAANTSQRHRFIFVDDCSADPRVWVLLSGWAKARRDCLLLRNDVNLGFVKTVNRAVKHVRSKVFVLLNTDVIVPPQWLERLIAPFFCDSLVASATPFSNAACFFGFPNFAADHKILEEENFLVLDKWFRRMREPRDESLEFVNGVGFCMGVRLKCWRRYGGFDEMAFGRGYGEESDWCMRVLAYGWKHVLVPNLYVYHNHGGSFPSEEKKRLGAEHFSVLEKRWPQYVRLLADFSRIDPWAGFRLAVWRGIASPPVDLIFVDVDSEDLEQCRRRIRVERSAVKSGLKVATLLYSVSKQTEWWLSFPQNDGFGASRLNGWDEAARWIDFLKPREVRVNGLMLCMDAEKVIHHLRAIVREPEDPPLDVVAVPVFSDSIVTKVVAAHRGLLSVAVRVGTFDRRNSCHLRMRLEDGRGGLVAERVAACGEMADNSLVALDFEPIQDSEGREYALRVWSDDSTDNDCVAVYAVPAQDAEAPEGAPELFVQARYAGLRKVPWRFVENIDGGEDSLGQER